MALFSPALAAPVSRRIALSSRPRQGARSGRDRRGTRPPTEVHAAHAVAEEELVAEMAALVEHAHQRGEGYCFSTTTRSLALMNTR